MAVNVSGLYDLSVKANVFCMASYNYTYSIGTSGTVPKQQEVLRSDSR